MLTQYHTILVEGFIRAIVGCFFVLVVLPHLLMPRLFPHEPWRNRAASVLAVGAFLVGIVHLLAYAHLNDSLSFGFVLAAFIIVQLWYSHLRHSDKRLEHYLASALRFLDSNSFKTLLQLIRGRFAALATRLTLTEMAFAILLVAVLSMSGLVRLLPAWQHAAPFSVEYYETLQKVKQLQINQIYTEGYRVPLGLPIVAELLSLSSQVSSALLLHFLGAFSSMFLAASVCYVIYRSTFSIRGGIIGAAVFGLFGTILPLDLRHQVEADSLVLATAFALPALSFFIEFCAQLEYKSLAVALAGLFVAATVNLFVGCFTLAGMILALGATLVFAYRLPWLHGMKLLITIVTTALLAAGFLFFFTAGLNKESLKVALEILLYDKHLNRYFSMYANLAPALHLACIALFGLTIFLSVFRYAHKAVSLHLLSWGLVGATIIVLVPYSYNGILSYIPFSQIAYLLSIVAAVTAGIAVGVIEGAVASLLQRLRAREFVSVSWKFLLVTAAVCFCWLVSPPQKVTMKFTAEPDGFATSLYLIEQQYMPYQWTVVSHRGTALGGMNRGRFLDYEYFFENYDPRTYRHGGKLAVPTPLLFFFIERAHEKTEIAAELSSTGRNAEQKIKSWLEIYEQQNHDLNVFYSDDKVVVYQLEDRAFHVLRG
jgi:hypothetical protein